MKNTQRYKILAALVVALAISTFASTQIFIANTIYINPVFISKVRKIPAKIIAFVQDPFSVKEYMAENARYNAAVFKDRPQIEIPKNVQYKALSKGLRLATDPITKKSYAVYDNTTKYSIKEADYNGKKIKFIVPQE